jgi:DNA-binding MarR family transcriptional regulator
LEFPSPRFKNDADASTGLIFIRAYNKWHTLIRDELRKVGITHPQFVVLTVLSYLSQSDENVSQVRIAHTADMDVMSVSQIVRGLEAKGYLARTDHPKDTRAYAVRLSAKGQETVKRALPAVEKIDDVFFSILGKDESVFRGFLHRLLQANTD